MQFALFVTGGLWVAAALTAAEHAAAGLALRFRLEVFQQLMVAAFLLFLLIVGFTAIHWVATRQAAWREVNELPKRQTSSREWRMGAAVGWAMMVVALMPMLLAGDLAPAFSFQLRSFGFAVLSLVTLLLFSLALEVAFRGYLFRRLMYAVGPTWAAILMAAVYGTVSAFHKEWSRLSVLVAFLMGLLLALAYLRTHALWLGWGLHFAWVASMAVLFGLPVGGNDSYWSIVDSNTDGANWVTGGLYGPEGAALTAVVALGGMAVLYALTRDLAWQYTQVPIVAAGYAMDVAPPAQHTAMEAAAAARPAPLVQILASTSTASSTLPAIEQHLSGVSETSTSERP